MEKIKKKFNFKKLSIVLSAFLVTVSLIFSLTCFSICSPDVVFAQVSKISVLRA